MISFALTEPFTYDTLWHACCTSVHKPLALKYLDDDGDEISFHTDMELASAIALRDDSGLLRLRGVVCPEMQDKYDAMMASSSATSVVSVPSELDSQASELSLDSSWYLADAHDGANASGEEETAEADDATDVAQAADPVDETTAASMASEPAVAEEAAQDEVSETADSEMSYVQVASPSLSSTEPAVVSIPSAAHQDDEPRICLTKAEFSSVLECKRCYSALPCRDLLPCLAFPAFIQASRAFLLF